MGDNLLEGRKMTDDSRLVLAISGGVHKVAPISQEPCTVLTQWQVFEVKNPSGKGWDIHFVGYAGYEGRVCSAVQSFDKTTMQGVTRSGRIYKLSGDSGVNLDAQYVWGRWLAMYGNPEVREITDQYSPLV